MKLSELSFADHAAVEILPALVRHFSYLGDRPEVEAARYAYRLADALAIERDSRNAVKDHERAELLRRVERAEKSLEVFQAMADYAPRIALSEIWEFLGVKNQTAAMQMLRDLLHGGAMPGPRENDFRAGFAKGHQFGLGTTMRCNEHSDGADRAWKDYANGRA